MRIKAESTLPSRATELSAGYDLYSCEDVHIPGIETLAGDNWVLVNTGVAVEIPTGCVGLVCPRSGLALNRGVTVLNAPGIIDSDYRGEIKVILVNFSRLSRAIMRGDRIAQLIVCPTIVAPIQEVRYLHPTERGSGGFGSTGD